MPQYKLKDLQGEGLKEDYIFDNKEEIIDNLADFHNQDWTDERYPTIYDLLDTLTEAEQLDYLCDYGSWEVVEIKS